MKNRIAILAGILCLCASSYAVTYKEDKTICEGTSFPTFTASAGSSYQWYRNNVIINGATNQSYTPTEAGEYTCVVGTSGSPVSTGNLLTYGGFNVDRNQWKGSRFSDSKYDPLTGRTLNIQYEFDNFDQNGVCDPGNYTTATNAKLVKPNYFQYIKPYEGTHLLVVDGRTNSSEFTFFFVRELQLKQGVTYEFSCQVANIDSLYFAKNHGTNSLPNLRFQIKTQDTNGQWVPLRPENSTNEGYLRVSENLGVWEEFKATYTAASNTWAEIRIQNTTNMNVVDGNDFAIDAIYFGANRTTEGSEEEEYFKVTVDKKYNAVLNDEALCPGTSTEVRVGFVTDNNMAMMPPTNAQYTWLWSDPNTGPQTASSESLTVTPNSTPGQTKTYNVEVKYSEVCDKATASMTVTTRSDCGNTETQEYTYSVCKDSPFALTAKNTGSSYTWDTGESGATIQVASANYESKIYTCTVVDGTTTYIEKHEIITSDCNQSYNDNICVLQEHSISAKTQGDRYEWTLPNGDTKEGQSINITINDIVPAEQYICKVYRNPNPESSIDAPLCAIETHTYGTYNCSDEIHHPEQAVCIGEEFELIPTTTADSYMWIQADGSGVRAPSMKDLLNQKTTKEYKCLAIKAANNEGDPRLEYNMMPNGDFEDTESTNNHYNGFTSSYTFYELDEDFPQRQGAQDDKNGYYRISSDASTSGNHYLECDGDDYEPENITISYAAILNGSIVKGQAYQFAFSGITIGGSNFANITFNLLLKDEAGNVIKTEPLISNQIINNTTWQQFGMGQNWTADNDYPQAEIQLINHTKGWGGNDFALDNIIFQAVYSNENNTEIILAEEYFTVVASECKNEEEWEVEFLKGSSQTIEPNVTGLGYKWFDQDGNPVLDENGQQVTTPTLTIVVDKTQHYTCEVDLGQGKIHYEYITVNVYDPINLTQCETDVVTLTPSKQGSYTWYLLGEDDSRTSIGKPIITGTSIHCEHLSTKNVNSILCVITTEEGTRDEQWNITVHANPTFEVTVTGRDATIETKSDYTNLVLDGQVEFTETWINTLNIGEHTLTMTDGYGCSSTSTFEVVPVPIKPMVFFTPNNDNNHDYWLVEGIDFYPEAVIQIFDRYHRLLTTLIGFENIKAGWDGMYNGHQMPMDDYWYVIMIPDNNQQISGHFTLKR